MQRHKITETEMVDDRDRDADRNNAAIAAMRSISAPSSRTNLHSCSANSNSDSTNNNIKKHNSLDHNHDFMITNNNIILTRAGSSSNHRHEVTTRFLESDNSPTKSNAIQRSQSQRPLPEFVASDGGGEDGGIFSPPIRAAIPPGRPPSLELRPRPLRDTQLGTFFRLITCSDTQIWAGSESGLRFWNFSDMYLNMGSGKTVRPSGDENAAPFHESVTTSSVMCMVMAIEKTG